MTCKPRSGGPIDLEEIKRNFHLFPRVPPFVGSEAFSPFSVSIRPSLGWDIKYVIIVLILHLFSNS